MDYEYSLRGLEFSYDGKQDVLSADRLDVAEGECVALLGPNGSGKTTLLKVLNGLLRPNSGSLFFRSKLIPGHGAALSYLRKHTVYVHQSPYLFAGSAAHNVAYGLRLRGCRGRDLSERTAKALAAVGMHDRAHRNGNTFSGGEMLRIGLARAIALETRCLLLDEPSAGADAESRSRIVHALLDLRKRGATIVLSTHEIPFAEALGSRFVRLEAGRIQEEDP